jgi:hypothetical protein
MKLWKISQKVNNDWDTYDSAVVAAETENDARYTEPTHDNDTVSEWNGIATRWSSWCDAKDVIVEYLGETDRVIPNKTVIVASFNAG